MGDLITYEDFYTLRMIRNSIKEQTRRNAEGKFDIAIRGEQALFKDYLSKLKAG